MGVDNDGHSPSDLARLEGHTEVAAALETCALRLRSGNWHSRSWPRSYGDASQRPLQLRSNSISKGSCHEAVA